MHVMRVMQIEHFALLQVRRLLDEGRVSVHDTTEEGEPLLSLACSAGYYELAQVCNESWYELASSVPGAPSFPYSLTSQNRMQYVVT